MLAAVMRLRQKQIVICNCCAVLSYVCARLTVQIVILRASCQPVNILIAFRHNHINADTVQLVCADGGFHIGSEIQCAAYSTVKVDDICHYNDSVCVDCCRIFYIHYNCVVLRYFVNCYGWRSQFRLYIVPYTFGYLSCFTTGIFS